MGRQKRRGGASSEASLDADCNALPLYCISRAPFARKFENVSVLVVLHSDGWPFSETKGARHSDGVEDLEENAQDDEEGTTTNESLNKNEDSTNDSKADQQEIDEEEEEGDGEEDDDADDGGDSKKAHVCTEWSGTVNKFFSDYELAGDAPPQVFLIDYTRVSKLVPAELSAPIGSLGPIAKQINKIVFKLNPKASAVAVHGAGCMYLLKILTEDKTALLERFSEILLVDPIMLSSFSRRFLQLYKNIASRLPKANVTKPRLVILNTDSDTTSTQSTPTSSSDSTSSAKLSLVDLVALMKQSNLFKDVEVASENPLQSETISEFQEDGSIISRATVAIRTSIDKAKSKEGDDEGEEAAEEYQQNFITEISWVQNQYSKQVEQKTIDITYELSC